MKRADVEAQLELHDDVVVLFADGFDDCILGVTAPGPNEVLRVVYDLDAMVRQLMRDDGLDWEEAWEYLSYNTVGGSHGPATPVYVWTE